VMTLLGVKIIWVAAISTTVSPRVNCRRVPWLLLPHVM
jgi:hypothetical protein